MNPKSTVLAAFVAAALASSAGVLAQSPNAPNPPSPPAPDMTGNPQTPKMNSDSKVEADYRAAQTTCNAQPVANRDQCLRDAKTKYDQDVRAGRMNNGSRLTTNKPMTNSNSGGGNGTSGAAGTAGDSGGHSGGTSGAGAGTAGGDNGGHSGGTSGGAGGASGGPK